MRHLILMLCAMFAFVACGAESVTATDNPAEFGQDAQGLGAAFVNGCTYKQSIKKLDGMIQTATGVFFPMKNLQLTLKDANNVVLDVLSIPPSVVMPGSSITQTVTVSYTSGVAKVSIAGTDDHSQYVWQNCDLI